MNLDPAAFDVERVGAVVRQPPLADLQARARGRRRRRRAGAGSAVLAVTAAAALVPFTLGPTAVPEPPPPASVFVDRYVWVGDHGYAIGVERPDDTCMPALTITQDAGRTWSDPVPAADPPCRRGDPVGDDALPADVRLEVLARTVFLLNVDGYTRLTRDGGGTWATLNDAVTDVAAFPAGAVLAACGGCVPGGRPLAVDAANALVYRLDGRMPALPTDLCEAADGTLWAWLPGDIDDPTRPGAGFVVRSTDRGRTWDSMPGPGGQVGAVACGSATAAYALVLHSDGEPPRVLATSDGGDSWRDFAGLAAGVDPRSMTIDGHGALVVWAVERGGMTRLTIAGGAVSAGYRVPDGVFVSCDGDRTWVQSTSVVVLIGDDDAYTIPLPPWWITPSPTPSR